MTVEQGTGAEAGVSEAAVIDFLRDSPDFFHRHPELLAAIALPHPDTGAAVSLIERQVSVLRERNDELQHKLHLLGQAARTNEQLLQRIQRLVLELVGTADLGALLERLGELVRHDFHADALSVRLLLPGVGPEFVSEGSTRLGSVRDVLTTRTPVCGHLTPEQLDFFFGSEGVEIASGAIIPLCEPGEERCTGMVAIGSIDPRRFHPEMGTVFLTHLGALLGRLIRLHAESAGDAA